MNKAHDLIRRILQSDLITVDKIRFISAMARIHTEQYTHNPHINIDEITPDEREDINLTVLNRLWNVVLVSGSSEELTYSAANIACSMSPDVWGCMDKNADNYNYQATMDCCCKYTVNPTPGG